MINKRIVAEIRRLVAEGLHQGPDGLEGCLHVNTDFYSIVPFVLFRIVSECYSRKGAAFSKRACFKERPYFPALGPAQKTSHSFCNRTAVRRRTRRPLHSPAVGIYIEAPNHKMKQQDTPGLSSDIRCLCLTVSRNDL